MAQLSENVIAGTFQHMVTYFHRSINITIVAKSAAEQNLGRPLVIQDSYVK